VLCAGAALPRPPRTLEDGPADNGMSEWDVKLSRSSNSLSAVDVIDADGATARLPARDDGRELVSRRFVEEAATMDPSISARRSSTLIAYAGTLGNFPRQPRDALTRTSRLEANIGIVVMLEASVPRFNIHVGACGCELDSATFFWDVSASFLGSVSSRLGRPQEGRRVHSAPALSFVTHECDAPLSTQLDLAANGASRRVSRAVDVPAAPQAVRSRASRRALLAGCCRTDERVEAALSPINRCRAQRRHRPRCCWRVGTRSFNCWSEL